jgi:divalent metal cation (Fe/Co/Zn/Cd) transporter
MLVAMATLGVTKERAALLGRALVFEWVTLAYNLAECVVGAILALAAGSVALLGFALDSAIESASAAVLVWRLQAEDSGRRSSEDAERRAVKLVAAAFLALGAYVVFEGGRDLLARAAPEASPGGIGLAAVSLVVMPWLAARKRALARRLDSRSLQADSRQTVLCAYLSALLLAGLAANAWFGWWWADPLAGIGIGTFALAEGRKLWRTEDLCCV